MSWLFSRALAEAYWAANSSDGAPSAPSKSTNTPAMYLSHAKTTEACRLSRYGMTCEHLTDDRGADVLMWSLAASPVRTSARQAPELESTESGAGCGQRWRALSVRYDPASSGWKTHRCLFPGDSIESLPTLPHWGSMQDGELWERTTPALRTDENDSGYCPTPTVCGNYNRPGTGAKSGTGLATAVKKWPTPTATAHKGWSRNHNRADTDDRIDYAVERRADQSGTPGRLNPDWCEWLMGWPVGWTRLDGVPKQYGWSIDPADTGEVPRVTTEKRHRAHRIRAIGNGQVPRALALAWEILTKKPG